MAAIGNSNSPMIISTNTTYIQGRSTQRRGEIIGLGARGFQSEMANYDDLGVLAEVFINKMNLTK
jgi:hypothetical protein